MIKDAHEEDFSLAEAGKSKEAELQAKELCEKFPKVSII